ncbi:hypothetical protein HII36_38045 [Nonomuraea sp. NN258]|uniref:ARPP-2 domain-containing protein n=1 Tax=Nonomuraea antri TaxID=2730852 RepID=UPI001568D6B0|nr:hypothetical protein [Nonomuraea antri]NRQ37592.1 hypothetical protein [Nonomuraea antri]
MIDLTGLETRPAQTWGAVRLVPLVRPRPIVDLRLHARAYGEDLTVVSLPDKTVYTSYVPHSFVASWTGDGTPAAAFGTQLGEPRECLPIRFERRMARRVDKNRLRFLPLHLAMEGFLALHFGGPLIAWEEWSRQALADGLSPRVEEAYTGAQITGLDDALKVFEIYPGQCGLLLYVADALAAAFVVPHPEDYRVLHPTLIRDMYGEQIYQYALFHSVADVPVRIDETRVSTLADLRAQAAGHERDWADFHDTVMAAGLTESHAYEMRVYRLGRFTLNRFLPSFDRRRENHIGETITDENGRLAYLKTFRLSVAQSKRGYLLSRLAEHGWNMTATAEALGATPAMLGMRLERAGFGHLLRQDVLDGYRKAERH